MVAVAAFRYIHLTIPNGRHLCGIKKANLAIVLTIIWAVIINFPQCLVYNIKIFNSTESNTTSNSNASWYVLDTDNKQFGNEKTINLLQFVISATLVKITPCVLLTVLSCALVKIILTAQDKYTAMQRRKGSTSTYSEQKRLRQTHQTTRMLIAVIVIFILIELPQGVLFVLSGLVKDFVDKIYWHLGNFMDLLTMIGCSINFLLYCLMSSQFCELLASLMKSFNPFMAKQEDAIVTRDISAE